MIYQAIHEGALSLLICASSRLPRHLFNASLRAFAGANVNFFEAAIFTIAPVEGCRPSRSGDDFTLNFPKP
jgi:hypothetical protein